MILILAAMVSDTQAFDSTSQADDEIVVTARRMAEVEVTLGRDPRGKIACAVRRSSGRTEIDNLICKDSAACLKPKAATREQIDVCIAARKPRLIKKIARRLKPARRAPSPR
jgi:hypothetical protein